MRPWGSIFIWGHPEMTMLGSIWPSSVQDRKNAVISHSSHVTEKHWWSTRLLEGGVMDWIFSGTVSIFFDVAFVIYNDLRCLNTRLWPMLLGWNLVPAQSYVDIETAAISDQWHDSSRKVLCRLCDPTGVIPYRRHWCCFFILRWSSEYEHWLCYSINILRQNALMGYDL